MKSILNIVLICMTILASCTNKEEPAGDGSGNGNASTYTVKLPSSTENGKLAWVPGDKLVVHGEKSKDQITITLSAEDISEDGRSCSIKVEGVPPYEQKGTSSVYYIAYPGDIVSNDKNCKDKSRFAATNDFLLAGYDKDKEFILESIVGGFTFTVDGSYDSYEFKGNNAEAVGYSSLTCRITENSKIYAYSKGDPMSSITGSIVSDDTNHICIPDNLNLADGFQLTLYSNGTPVKTLYTETPYEVKRDEFLPLGNITSSLVDYKVPEADTHVSAIPTGNAVDLSSVEPANCYIVTEPGVYAFKSSQGIQHRAFGIHRLGRDSLGVMGNYRRSGTVQHHSSG